MIFKLSFIFCLLIGWTGSAALTAQQKKKTAAVLEFNSSDLSKKDLTILSNRFRSILVKTNAFDVVEREKMNDILREQNFTISDNCNSAECAVQIGKLLGVEAMVAGDVGKLGGTYSIDLRLIDVTTGKIIQAETQDYKGEIDGLLGAMTAIANSFAGIRTSVATNTSADGEIAADGRFTDLRDGKKYKTVKIGNQVWMAENLNYESSTGSWCYDNKISSCDKYGRLYDWKTACSAAPAGWHLPSKSEFEQLMRYLGDDAKTIYPKLIEGGSSGFNVLFGGWRGSDARSYNVGSGSSLWCSSEFNTDSAWYLDLYGKPGAVLGNNSGSKGYALYVRCVKD
jgi:uncharacterized protein (TIGR02145 family)